MRISLPLLSGCRAPEAALNGPPSWVVWTIQNGQSVCGCSHKRPALVRPYSAIGFAHAPERQSRSVIIADRGRRARSVLIGNLRQRAEGRPRTERAFCARAGVGRHAGPRASSSGCPGSTAALRPTSWSATATRPPTCTWLTIQPRRCSGVGLPALDRADGPRVRAGREPASCSMRPRPSPRCRPLSVPGRCRSRRPTRMTVSLPAISLRPKMGLQFPRPSRLSRAVSLRLLVVSAVLVGAGGGGQRGDGRAGSLGGGGLEGKGGCHGGQAWTDCL